MGRGKVEIKRIENRTNRQVTYSKRRNGLLKKARELTVLCDAKVSILMFSNTGKFHEFISPSISHKKIYDQYQKNMLIDLWRPHYERMQENLGKLKEINFKLRREIGQRIGEDLGDLRFDELQGLEQEMSSAVQEIRQRRDHVLISQTNKFGKKVKNLEQVHKNLLLNLEGKYDELQYGCVENGREYESGIGVEANDGGGPNLYGFHLEHAHHPDLHHGAGGMISHDLRLA